MRTSVIALVVVVTVACGGGEDRPGTTRPARDLIAFAARPEVGGSGAWEIFVADLSTGRVRQLTHDFGMDPTWSPDGSQIAFEGPSAGPCNSGFCTRIWLMAADGSNKQPLTPPDRRTEEPAWSPTGDHIAYTQWRPSSDLSNRASIYTRAIDGSGVKRLTTAEKVFDSDPAWSPDGRRIAFVRDMGREYALYVMNADGTDQRRLRAAKADAFGPAWSPDGRRLAVWRSCDDPRWCIYASALIAVLNAGGGDERPLVRGADQPVWSPDGRFIAYVPENPSGGIWVVRPDGTGRRKLVAGPFTEPYSPDWVRRSGA